MDKTKIDSVQQRLSDLESQCALWKKRITFLEGKIETMEKKGRQSALDDVGKQNDQFEDESLPSVERYSAEQRCFK